MPKLIDLTGQKFNRLTVLNRAENKNGRVAWNCQCDCGNKIIVTSKHLRDNHTQSCGCLRKERAGKRNFKNIQGLRFGKLFIEKYAYSNKVGGAMWQCKCDCGNVIIARGADLRNGHTKSCGCISSFGQQKIFQLLKQANFKVQTQKTFENCRFKDTHMLARFDFFVNDSYLIEYDGKQHFQWSSYGWDNKQNFNKIVEHDKFKNDWCVINEIPLIRIPYTHFNNIKIEDLILETTKFRVT